MTVTMVHDYNIIFMSSSTEEFLQIWPKVAPFKILCISSLQLVFSAVLRP